MNQKKTHFILCNGKSCTRKGAEALTVSLRMTITEAELSGLLYTTKSLCNGQCKHGPIVIAYPRGDWYGSMTPQLAKKLVQAEEKYDRFTNNLLYQYKNGRFIN